MNRKMRLWICIIVILLIIFCIPVVVDWLIVGNDIPSNITNSEWVSFLGSYIGAIIGAVVSLISIIITIRYTNEQNRIDRELQVRPYCTIKYVQDDKLVETQNILGYIMIGCEPRDNNGPKYQSVIYIKNVGMGPALEFEFETDEIDDGREHYLILPQRTSETANHSVDMLQPGETAAIPILIEFNFDKVPPENVKISDMAPLIKYDIDPCEREKYKNFGIAIKIRYSDIYNNIYSQSIHLQTNMYMIITKDGVASHQCDIIMVESTLPINEKRAKNK